MALHHLIYLSTPTAAYDEAALRELLTTSQANNAAQDITGVLFYGPQHFLQLIEGEAEVLATLYARLQDDPRHRGLLKLADKPVPTRVLPDWSMALRLLDVPGLAGSAGLRDLSQLDIDTLGLPAADALLLRLVQQQLLGSQD